MPSVRAKDVALTSVDFYGHELVKLAGLSPSSKVLHANNFGGNVIVQFYDPMKTFPGGETVDETTEAEATITS